MLISVVIPAFNEEDYLGETLASLYRAIAFLKKNESTSAEIIVVDNNSLDSTADIARDFGATVVKEALHNVAKVRNTGARFAKGSVLIFVDADTIVPNELLWRIIEVVAEPTCIGGAVNTDYRPVKLTSKIYLKFWQIIGKVIRYGSGRDTGDKFEIASRTLEFIEAHGQPSAFTHWLRKDYDLCTSPGRQASRQTSGV